VVPDLQELVASLGRSRTSLARCVRRTLDRDRQRLDHLRSRLDRAPALALERKRASLEHARGRLGTLSPLSTLARGYAIVRSPLGIVATTSQVARGDTIDVEVADGHFGATVD
jgi:exodeoxyribonuclease VII large subunit